jgi:rod shape-determining protein MreD
MRLLLALLLTLFLSGLLSALWPQGLMAPDLFLVLALWYAQGSPAYLGLPVAFLLGLLQDLLGYGLVGLHGVGLLFAAYAYYAANRRLASGESLPALVAFAWALCRQVAGPLPGGLLAEAGNPPSHPPGPPPRGPLHPPPLPPGPAL